MDKELIKKYKSKQRHLKNFIEKIFDTRVVYLKDYRIRYGNTPEYEKTESYISYLNTHVCFLYQIYSFRQEYYNTFSLQNEDKGHKFAREIFKWMYDIGIEKIKSISSDFTDKNMWDVLEIECVVPVSNISFKREPKKKKKKASSYKLTEEEILNKESSSSMELAYKIFYVLVTNNYTFIPYNIAEKVLMLGSELLYFPDPVLLGDKTGLISPLFLYYLLEITPEICIENYNNFDQKLDFISEVKNNLFKKMEYILLLIMNNYVILKNINKIDGCCMQCKAYKYMGHTNTICCSKPDPGNLDFYSDRLISMITENCAGTMKYCFFNNKNIPIMIPMPPLNRKTMKYLENFFWRTSPISKVIYNSFVFKTLIKERCSSDQFFIDGDKNNMSENILRLIGDMDIKPLKKNFEDIVNSSKGKEVNFIKHICKCKSCIRNPLIKKDIHSKKYYM